MRASGPKKLRQFTCLVLAISMIAVIGPLNADTSQAAQQAPSADQAAPKIPDDQLDSLVAPVALYPDPLLAQVLAASTYPLEIIQLQLAHDCQK
jgi:hypothetical protein